MMSAPQLDSLQLKAFNAFQKSGRLILTGDKFSGKSFLLRYIAAQEIKLHSKLLFVLDDHQSCLAEMALMHHFGFRSECLILKKDEFMNAQSLNQIRSILKSESPEFSFELEWERNSMSKAMSAKLHEHYKKLSQNALFGKSWQELAILNAFDRNSFQTRHFNHLLPWQSFVYDEAEYEQLFLLVKKAFEMHKNGLSFTDHLFTRKNYISGNANEDWLSLNEWIVNVKKKATQLIIGITRYLENKASEKIAEQSYEIMPFFEKCQILMESVAFLKEKINKGKEHVFIEEEREHIEEMIAKIDREMLLFSRELKDKLGVVEYEDSFHKIFQSEETLDLDQMLKDLSKLKSELHERMIKGDFVIFKSLKSITIQNSTDPLLAKIDKELKGFYQFLSNQEYLDRKFEKTAFSLSKELSQLQAILNEMNELQSYANRFVKYYEWNHFLMGLEEAHSLLIESILLIQPNDWLRFFRTWYVNNLIEFRKSTEKRDAGLIISEAIESHTRLLDYENDNYRKEKSIILGQELNTLKIRNRSLYKNILKKSNFFEWPSERYLEEDAHFVQSAYPLHFISTRELLSMNKEFLSKYDCLLIDSEENMDSILSIFSSQKRKDQKLAIVDSNDKGPFISHFIEKAMLFEKIDMQAYHQQNVTELSSLSAAERIHAARYIAYILKDSNPDISIYHLGKTIIYSCLSDPLDKILEQSLDKKGLKKMKVLESPFHLLVENIMESDSRQLLLIQDMIINSDQSERYLWMEEVKNKVKKAGIEIVNLNTFLLLESPLNYLKEFVSEYLLNESQGLEKN